MEKITLPSTSKMMQPGFIYGVATSSFQIEGDRAGRLPCIWDTFCNVKGAIIDGSNGDTACEHVRLWREDVKLIASLGVDAYRLSIAWPRVIQEDGSINPGGMRFYRELIADLNRAGIAVFVTFYHWDLPHYLEDRGGWLNRQTAFAFADYVALVVDELGDTVASYATLNEPFCSAYLGYEIGVHAPGLTGQKQGRAAAHHLLLAHGLAMQVLREKSPDTLNGIVLNFSPCYPYTDSDADRRAAEQADQYMNQWYIRPLMEGRYPDVIDEIPPDARPPVVPGDMDIIAGALDFIGINYYTRAVFRASGDGWFEEVKVNDYPLTDMGWEICPEAFTELLLDLNTRYRLPPLYITENGAAMPDTLKDGAVNDTDRIAYFNGHLNAVDKAIRQGVRIDGYFAWSLMDNFEWALGYTKRFGLVYVDYQTQQRVLKNSALSYRNLISARSQRD